MAEPLAIAGSVATVTSLIGVILKGLTGIIAGWGARKQDFEPRIYQHFLATNEVLDYFYRNPTLFPQESVWVLSQMCQICNGIQDLFSKYEDKGTANKVVRAVVGRNVTEKYGDKIDLLLKDFQGLMVILLAYKSGNDKESLKNIMSILAGVNASLDRIEKRIEEGNKKSLAAIEDMEALNRIRDSKVDQTEKEIEKLAFNNMKATIENYRSDYGLISLAGDPFWNDIYSRYKDTECENAAALHVPRPSTSDASFFEGDVNLLWGNEESISVLDLFRKWSEVARERSKMPKPYGSN